MELFIYLQCNVNYIGEYKFFWFFFFLFLFLFFPFGVGGILEIVSTFVIPHY